MLLIDNTWLRSILAHFRVFFSRLTEMSAIFLCRTSVALLLRVWWDEISYCHISLRCRCIHSNLQLCRLSLCDSESITSCCRLSHCQYLFLSLCTLFISPYICLSVRVVGAAILYSVTRHWLALIRKTTSVNLNATIMLSKTNCHRSFHRRCIQT